MTKAEKCRRIAEWLEPLQATVLGQRHPPFLQPSPKGAWIGDKDHEWEARDYYESEEANALVLEKLMQANFCITSDKCGVLITAPPDPATHVVQTLVDTNAGWSRDRQREAICTAFLKWIEQEKR